MTKEEYKLHKRVKKWNVVASVFFIMLIIILYGIFLQIKPENFSVSLFDIVILSLANHRLIRLFLYDHITLFLREFFMDLEIVGVEEYRKYNYIESKNSFKLTMYKLLNCPWCFGVWSVFISSFLYFNFLAFKIIFLLLAISSLASFLILFTNFIGWSAEEKKIKSTK